MGIDALQVTPSSGSFLGSPLWSGRSDVVTDFPVALTGSTLLQLASPIPISSIVLSSFSEPTQIWAAMDATYMPPVGATYMPPIPGKRNIDPFNRHFGHSGVLLGQGWVNTGLTLACNGRLMNIWSIICGAGQSTAISTTVYGCNLAIFVIPCGTYFFIKKSEINRVSNDYSKLCNQRC